MKLKIRRIHPDASIPAFAYLGGAGMDLTVVEEVTLGPDESADIPIGIEIELPLGYWGMIVGRSSTLRKKGLYTNIGVIDNGYRGPIFAYVRNMNGQPVTVRPGDRLVQLIPLPYVQPVVVEVDELDRSDRGANGFGSSGLRGAMEVS